MKDMLPEEQRRTERFVLRLAQADRAAIDTAARKLGLSRSQIVRQAIEQYAAQFAAQLGNGDGTGVHDG